MATLMSNELGLKTRNITREKESHFLMLKVLVCQKDTTIVAFKMYTYLRIEPQHT